MPSCITCSDGTHCTTCQGGFFVNSTSNACSLCDDQIPGCIGCAHETLCVLCKQDYTLTAGSCVAPTPPGPTQVYSFCQLNNCLSCDHNNGTDTIECIKCIPSHYLDGNGDCQECSGSVTNCAKCSTSGTCDEC